jgi:hypothetical protein
MGASEQPSANIADSHSWDTPLLRDLTGVLPAQFST